MGVQVLMVLCVVLIAVCLAALMVIRYYKWMLFQQAMMPGPSLMPGLTMVHGPSICPTCQMAALTRGGCVGCQGNLHLASQCAACRLRATRYGADTPLGF